MRGRGLSLWAHVAMSDWQRCCTLHNLTLTRVGVALLHVQEGRYWHQYVPAIEWTCLCLATGQGQGGSAAGGSREVASIPVAGQLVHVAGAN